MRELGLIGACYEQGQMLHADRLLSFGHAYCWAIYYPTCAGKEKGIAELQQAPAQLESQQMWVVLNRMPCPMPGMQMHIKLYSFS